MVSFVILGSFTEQGISNIKNVDQLRQAAEQWTTGHGGRVIANYTTLGQYDFVFIVEVPSPETVLEGAFLFGSQGDVRTQTLLAFAADEAATIAQRIP